MPPKIIKEVTQKVRDNEVLAAKLQALRDKHKGKLPGDFSAADRNEWIELKMIEELS